MPLRCFMWPSRHHSSYTRDMDSDTLTAVAKHCGAFALWRTGVKEKHFRSCLYVLSYCLPSHSLSLHFFYVLLIPPPVSSTLQDNKEKKRVWLSVVDPQWTLGNKRQVSLCVNSWILRDYIKLLQGYLNTGELQDFQSNYEAFITPRAKPWSSLFCMVYSVFAQTYWYDRSSM